MTTAVRTRLRPAPGTRPRPETGTRLRPGTGTRSGAAALGRVAVTRGRVAAALTLGSAALHVVLAASGELSPGSLAGWAMAAMALVCLPCAVHLWRAPSASVWGLTALVDLGMLALHAPMVAGGGTAGMQDMPGHGAGGVAVLAVVALVLVVGQLALAASVGLTALLRR